MCVQMLVTNKGEQKDIRNKADISVFVPKD